MNNRRIYIEINNTCNFACNFCPYPLIKSKKCIMDVKKIKDIIDDIVNNISYRIIYFHNLNEPFLHPNIDEIIKYCNDKNVEYGITTNGTLLHKHISTLKNSKMKELNISYQVIDCDENKSRNNKMSVDKYREYLVENINKFRNEFKGEIKIKLLMTNKDSVFNKKKIKGIETLDELIEEINKFYYLFLNKNLNNDQIKKISMLNIKKFCKINIFDNIYIELFPFLTWGNYYDKVHKAYFGKCDGLVGQIQIKVNGDVLPCCYDFNSELNIGNVNDLPLSRVIKSKKYEEFYKNLLSKKIKYSRCKTCLGNKKLCKLLKEECEFLLKSKVEDRFIFSNNNIKL